jgi:hypothetical protein
MMHRIVCSSGTYGIPAGATAPIAPQPTPYIVPDTCYSVSSRTGVVTNMVDPRFSSPLNQVFSRGPSSAWQRVGFVAKEGHAVDTGAKTMPLFMRAYGGRSRYDYRVVDNNGVAIDVATNVRWKDDDDKVDVTAYGKYKIKIYSEFR